MKHSAHTFRGRCSGRCEPVGFRNYCVAQHGGGQMNKKLHAWAACACLPCVTRSFHYIACRTQKPLRSAAGKAYGLDFLHAWAVCALLGHVAAKKEEVLFPRHPRHHATYCSGVGTLILSCGLPLSQIMSAPLTTKCFWCCRRHDG